MSNPAGHPSSLSGAAQEIADATSSRWHPHAHLRALPAADKRALFEARLASPHLQIFREGGNFMAVQRLDWDSDFFGEGHARVEAARFDNVERGVPLIAEAERTLASSGIAYVFAQVPAEDSAVSDALGRAGWSVIETRTNFFFDDMAAHQPRRRHEVRLATAADAPILGRIAMQAVNRHDRFHADPHLAPKADEMLRLFAERSINAGFADEVIVPRTGPTAFLTYRYFRVVPTSPLIGQMVLGAAAPQAIGWFLRLVSEGLIRLREKGAVVATLTTQAANHGVSRGIQSLGFQLGSATLLMRKVLASSSTR